MKRLRYVVIAVGLLTTPLTIFAEDWVPKRIVAITDYVPLGRQARISGEVVIRCYLDSTGSVVRADIVSGHPILKGQARENALQWKFQRVTSTHEGSDSVTLTYKYRLDGEPQYSGGTSFQVDLPNEILIIAPVAYVNP